MRLCVAGQTIRATRGPPKGRSGCRAPQEGAASASRTKDQTSIRHSLLCVYASQDKRFVQREARSRAEADAGHRKRALLPLPARETQRAFAISHGKRIVQREARSRAEADAGHRKRALLPLPARETQRAFAISHGKRFVQREARPRAEADAGHRKRALLPLPARETQRAFAISHGKRFVQREARSRAEADAGHRKRALLPLPARETQTSIRHSLLCVAGQTIRAARAPSPCDRQCSTAAHKRITTVPDSPSIL